MVVVMEEERQYSELLCKDEINTAMTGIDAVTTVRTQYVPNTVPTTVEVERAQAGRSQDWSMAGMADSSLRSTVREKRKEEEDSV